MHRIAPKASALSEVEPLDFELVFGRDGVEEPHEFTAIPRLSYGDTVGITRYQGDGARMLPILDRLIRRMLINTDGTPAKWAPQPVGDGQVYGPDGTPITPEEAEALAAFDAGSSRRRWIQLMEHDDDVTVELEQIMELFELLTSMAGGDRPT